MAKKPHFDLHIIQLHFGVYDYTAFIVFGKKTEAARFIQFQHGEEPGKDEYLKTRMGGSKGTISFKTGRAPVIWMPRFPVTGDEMATLAHEGMHLVNAIMGWADISLTPETDEAYCHALGYFMRQVLSCKQKKGKR